MDQLHYLYVQYSIIKFLSINFLFKNVGATSTVAGMASVLGAIDGAATTEATFNYPTAIALDTTGVIYIVDSLNHLIRVLYTTGTSTRSIDANCLFVCFLDICLHVCCSIIYVSL